LLFRPVAKKSPGPTPERWVAPARSKPWSITSHRPPASRVADDTTNLLESAQDEFDHCGGEVEQCGYLGGGGLFEERYSLLDEPAKRILRGLAAGENRGFVEYNVQRVRGDGHYQSARRPLDLFKKSLYDFPTFSSHVSPSPTSSPIPRHNLNTITPAREHEQRMEVVARLGLGTGQVRAKPSLFHGLPVRKHDQAASRP